MARTKVDVPKDKIQAAITEAEKSAEGGAFPTRRGLFEAVAAKLLGAGIANVTSSIVAARFEEFGLTCNTQKSKRGRPLGTKNKPDSAVEIPVLPKKQPKPTAIKTKLDEISPGEEPVEESGPVVNPEPTNLSTRN